MTGVASRLMQRAQRGRSTGSIARIRGPFRRVWEIGASSRVASARQRVIRSTRSERQSGQVLGHYPCVGPSRISAIRYAFEHIEQPPRECLSCCAERVA